MRVRFATSARRHKVGKTRALQVIRNPRATFVVSGPEGRDDRIVYLGDDHTGRALEVMAVELDDGSLYVIHVMDLRDKYRPFYQQQEGTP